MQHPQPLQQAPATAPVISSSNASSGSRFKVTPVKEESPAPDDASLASQLQFMTNQPNNAPLEHHEHAPFPSYGQNQGQPYNAVDGPSSLQPQIEQQSQSQPQQLQQQQQQTQQHQIPSEGIQSGRNQHPGFSQSDYHPTMPQNFPHFLENFENSLQGTPEMTLITGGDSKRGMLQQASLDKDKPDR